MPPSTQKPKRPQKPDDNRRINHWDYTVHQTDITLATLGFISTLFTPANTLIGARFAEPFYYHDPHLNPGLILDFTPTSPASALTELKRSTWFCEVGRSRIRWKIENYHVWRAKSEACFMADPFEWCPEEKEVNGKVLETYYPDLKEERDGMQSDWTTVVEECDETTGQVLRLSRYREPNSVLDLTNWGSFRIRPRRTTRTPATVSRTETGIVSEWEF